MKLLGLQPEWALFQDMWRGIILGQTSKQTLAKREEIDVFKIIDDETYIPKTSSTMKSYIANIIEKTCIPEQFAMTAQQHLFEERRRGQESTIEVTIFSFTISLLYRLWWVKQNFSNKICYIVPQFLHSGTKIGSHSSLLHYYLATQGIQNTLLYNVFSKSTVSGLY